MILRYVYETKRSCFDITVLIINNIFDLLYIPSSKRAFSGLVYCYFIYLFHFSIVISIIFYCLNQYFVVVVWVSHCYGSELEVLHSMTAAVMSAISKSDSSSTTSSDMVLKIFPFSLLLRHSASLLLRLSAHGGPAAENRCW